VVVVVLDAAFGVVVLVVEGLVVAVDCLAPVVLVVVLLGALGLVVVVVDFDVVAVEPRAAVVDVVFGFVDEVVSLSPVVVVVAPALAVVVVVGLAFFGSGTVQVRRDEPS
jgi:hypothetical protein